MIHLISDNKITDSWSNYPKVVKLPDGTNLHAQYELKRQGVEYLESQGLYREQRQSVELGENEYISGYTGPTVIDGKPYRVPVISTKTKDEMDQELVNWRDGCSVRTAAARLVLLQYDMLDAVEAVVAKDRSATIMWEYETHIRRMHPLVLSLTPILGYTEEQLDNLFKEAEQL